MENINGCKKAVLRLYNTATKKKESLDCHLDRPLRLYTCGPTVYDFAHIGNFRTYIFEDLLRRTLQYFGHRVMQVMNITDVDDKTIRGAIRKGSLKLSESLWKGLKPTLPKRWAK